MPAFFVSQYVEKSGKLPTGPRSRKSADYLNRAIETSDIAESCKAIGVVSHRHNISDIAKKPGLKDRAFIERCRQPNASKL